MSFTTGGLFLQESVQLAQLYLELMDWDKLTQRATKENLLQVRTQSSSKRIAREIISRLKQLSQIELEALIPASSRDRAYLLWLAICRRYAFIAEFAREVLRERYIRLQPDLTPNDFDLFFNKKAEWNPELDRLEEAINKIRSRDYLLPAIQRNFVWSTHQICVLFDSIMRGYSATI